MSEMVLICGGAGGIGAAMARRLRERHGSEPGGRGPRAAGALAAEPGATFTVGEVLEAELSARAAGWTTGQILGVDGGRSTLRTRT